MGFIGKIEDVLVNKILRQTFYNLSREREYVNYKNRFYHDCGQFYICDVNTFMKRKTLVGNNTMPFVVPGEEVQDIDNISDWLIAEAKYRVLNEQ